MARRIEEIVVHCSATRPSWNAGAAEIRALHTGTANVPWDGGMVPGFGWQDIGYHYIIRRDGYIEDGRPEQSVGAHAKGHNRHSIGVCLVGGVAEDGTTPEANFTKAQYGALEALLDDLLWRYKAASVLGHRDIPGVTKACPSFNVKAWWDGS